MAKGRLFTPDEEQFIAANYGVSDVMSIARKLRRSTLSVYVYANRKGIKKNADKGRLWNKTEWTSEMIDFLKSKFFHSTNKQIAEALGLKLTVVRNKAAEIGLKRIEMEYWTDEQLIFLHANYRTMGDVEIAENLQQLFPKKKPWTKQHICKKRKYLELRRTKEQIDAIRTRNSSEGGNAYTINRNSSSINMHDSWIAGRLGWRNKKLADHIKKNHPELIELKRAELKLRRTIKNKIHGKK